MTSPSEEGYKLTTQNLTTLVDFQWTVGEKVTTSGEGELCGPGWIHYYRHPLVAVLHNPAHANFRDPKLFKIEVGGRQEHDGWMKSGATEVTLIEEMVVPKISFEERVRYAIGCILAVGDHGTVVSDWARCWLSEEDRLVRTPWLEVRTKGQVAWAEVDLPRIAEWAVGNSLKFPLADFQRRNDE